MFRGNILFPLSVLKSKPLKLAASKDFLIASAEDGSSIFSRNVGKPPADYTTTHAQTKVLFTKTISKERPLPVGEGRECVASTSFSSFVGRLTTLTLLKLYRVGW